MNAEINLAGKTYVIDWHEGMQSFLIKFPDGSFWKIGGTLNVALINMWDYIEIPPCFSGDENRLASAKLSINRKVAAAYTKFRFGVDTD